ncbi:GNAT family N-acetyltransferase [Xanthomonas oryzae]|uniref:GNAT family N-acetyltransferase n=1 Tax=Xanthomonas oryzae TaxID=347 RepID=UPI000949CB96|nr:GNAT family N-acetyltransferase [Xanthomonas oryzae]OLG31417.1 acetyltransferase [Xanthomonas oryzae pv. oryzae]QGN64653.1 N-acetyltransferase [Xanthomonas oryzae pv. oryzae]
MSQGNELTYEQFKNIDLSDSFFDSLKDDYAEFPTWFKKKAEDRAYIFKRDQGAIDGFLYLKIEEGALNDVSPPLPPARRIKVGTFKLNAIGTKLGERFLKKVFDHAIHNRISLIYVTVFSKHEALLRLFKRHGFIRVAHKATANGEELVLQKDFKAPYSDPVVSYPSIPLGKNRCYLLSLRPAWHTRLLPDSILRTESQDIVQDVSHTNSIHKVYLAAMKGTEQLKPKDVLVIYRTAPQGGQPWFESVATTIGVVEESRHIDSFASRDEFKAYCSPYSIFTNEELDGCWKNKKYPNIFKFTYNVALKKRPNRARLVEDVGLSKDAYCGFMPLTFDQLRHIAQLGEIDESLIVNQA